jgi:hypothetical protein
MKEQGESEAEKLKHWREVENRIFEQRKSVARLAVVAAPKKSSVVTHSSSSTIASSEASASSKHFYGSSGGSSSAAAEVPAVVAAASSVPWNLIYDEKQREQYEHSSSSYAVRTINQQVIKYAGRPESYVVHIRR